MSVASIPAPAPAPDAAPAAPRSDIGKLVILMITAFVDMVGLLIVIPLLPFYAKHLGGSGIEVPLLGGTYHMGIGQIVAVLVSAYTVAQLLSAPMWGRFSDRLGRRPVLAPVSLPHRRPPVSTASIRTGNR